MIRQLLLISISFLLLLYSCENKQTQNSSYSLKDSVLKEYLLSLDSIEYYDTTDANYKVLKAYKNNDTDYLNSLHNEIQDQQKRRNQFGIGTQDSCIHQLNLSALNVDEAYRLIYLPGWCPYKLNVTVTQKADDINLHFIIYKSKFDSCRIINEYDKKLTDKDWENILRSLQEVGFWGLKRTDSYDAELDGGMTTLIGYIKGGTIRNYAHPAKVNYVSRSGPMLRQAIDVVLGISGNKQGCYVVTTSTK